MLPHLFSTLTVGEDTKLPFLDYPIIRFDLDTCVVNESKVEVCWGFLENLYFLATDAAFSASSLFFMNVDLTAGAAAIIVQPWLTGQESSREPCLDSLEPLKYTAQLALDFLCGKTNPVYSHYCLIGYSSTPSWIIFLIQREKLRNQNIYSSGPVFNC